MKSTVMLNFGYPFDKALIDGNGNGKLVSKKCENMAIAAATFAFHIPLYFVALIAAKGIGGSIGNMEKAAKICFSAASVLPVIIGAISQFVPQIRKRKGKAILENDLLAYQCISTISRFVEIPLMVITCIGILSIGAIVTPPIAFLAVLGASIVSAVWHYLSIGIGWAARAKVLGKPVGTISGFFDGFASEFSMIRFFQGLSRQASEKCHNALEDAGRIAGKAYSYFIYPQIASVLLGIAISIAKKLPPSKYYYALAGVLIFLKPLVIAAKFHMSVSISNVDGLPVDATIIDDSAMPIGK